MVLARERHSDPEVSPRDAQPIRAYDMKDRIFAFEAAKLGVGQHDVSNSRTGDNRTHVVTHVPTGCGRTSMDLAGHQTPLFSAPLMGLWTPPDIRGRLDGGVSSLGLTSLCPRFPDNTEINRLFELLTHSHLRRDAWNAA